EGPAWAGPFGGGLPHADSRPGPLTSGIGTADVILAHRCPPPSPRRAARRPVRPYGRRPARRLRGGPLFFPAAGRPAPLATAVTLAEMFLLAGCGVAGIGSAVAVLPLPAPRKPGGASLASRMPESPGITPSAKPAFGES